MLLPGRVTIEKAIKKYGILLCCMVLVSCGKETLIENTTQKRAVQIVVALYKRGIAASSSRESGGQGKYRVQTAAKDYAHALAILEREGLMEDPTPSMSELTASSSFFPASREMEALRLDYALSQDVKGLLEALPGVEHAQVLVRKRFGAKDEIAPTVSVVIRARAKAVVAEPAVVEVIKRSIPGVEADKILLSIDSGAGEKLDGSSENIIAGEPSELLMPFLFNWRVPRSDYKGFALLFLSCMFLVGSVGLGLGYILGKIRERSVRTNGEQSDSIGNTSRIERTRRDLLEG